MEYLSPGVFIEETSFRARAIEGVSTSTAGFVGRAQWGPSDRPVLVTSFADFQREFGAPYAAPNAAAGEHLGHAVRGFFVNGGRRAWVVRVLGTGTAPSAQTAALGIVLRVRSAVREGETLVAVDTLRGVGNGSSVVVHWRPDADTPWTALAPIALGGYDTAAGTLSLASGLPSGVTLRPGHAYLYIDGAAPNTMPGDTKRPVFTAANDGAAGDSLAVHIRAADRPPAAITANVLNGSAEVEVGNIGSFYEGAIVELDAKGERFYGTVAGVERSTRTVTLSDTIGGLGVSGDIDVSTGTHTLRVLELAVDVLRDGAVVESFPNLHWNAGATGSVAERYLHTRINDAASGSRLVRVSGDPLTAAIADAPVTPDGLAMSLVGGNDGAAPTPVQLVGTDGGPGARTGLQLLTERDDVSMVAMPGVTDEFAQQELIGHAERMRYRVAVLDGVAGRPTVTELENHRGEYDSKYAAYYAPWLRAVELGSGREIEVPPSGHVMGIYARTDNERGVHKAPANEVVRGIVALAQTFVQGEQDVLNPFGVNLIRELDRRGTRVWGARTVSSDSEWKYVNVRRYFCYLEASIDRGTQWVVFEPNGPALWDRVRQTVTSFLNGEWRAGRLFGTKPEEAFFVRCDRSTMTQSDIDSGRLICEVGVAPLYPAEFVVFRIGQFTASAEG